MRIDLTRGFCDYPPGTFAKEGTGEMTDRYLPEVPAEFLSEGYRRSEQAIRTELSGDKIKLDVLPKMKVVLEHEDSEECWCEPELEYEDPETGVQVWVHRETH